MMPSTNTTTTVPRIMAVINAANSLFMETCRGIGFALDHLTPVAEGTGDVLP
jgi:hypothetical protein